MKKTIALTLLLGGGLVLSGCTSTLLGNSGTVSETIIERKTMAFQATTGISLVQGLKTQAPLNAKRNVDEPVPTGDIPVATLDLLFSNGANFAVEAQTSDRAEYEFLDVISFDVFDDTAITYSLYYNAAILPVDEDDEEDIIITTEEDVIEEETSPEVEISAKGNHSNRDDEKDEDSEKGHHGNGNHGEGNGDQDRDHDHDRDHDNNETKVTGIAVIGDEEYQFVSKTELDVDSDEQEIEMKFMIYKDKENFVQIKQEIEIEGVKGEEGYEYEEEFKYTVVEDGKVTKSFKLAIEEEDGEQELSVKIDAIKYEVTYEVIDERTFIHVKVKGQGEFVYEKIVTVDAETNEASVEYILQ